jgi:mannose-1-phosphate guanylyltransferase
VPKCLVPIRGRPLLAYWLAHLAREGLTDVLLNVSQLPHLVERFLADHPGPPSVTLVVEQRPVGTAGTVRRHRAFVHGEESFWVFYADNLTDCAFAPVETFHRSHDGLLTLGLFRAPDPRAAGIVELNGRGRVVGLEEKPLHPRGDLANAGVYLARQGLLDVIPVGDDVVDFGFDVLPRCIGQLYGIPLVGFHLDVGTPAALERAEREWPYPPMVTP